VELEADVGLVEVAVEVIDPAGIECGGVPLDAVDNVALASKSPAR
jgi:hypothetical protein